MPGLLRNMIALGVSNSKSRINRINEHTHSDKSSRQTHTRAHGINNNNRELIERFWNLKALYKLETYNAQIPIIIQINSIQAYKTYDN